MNKMQMRTALAEALEVIKLAQNFCGDVGADPKDNTTYKACNLWLDEHREEIKSLPSNEDMGEAFLTTVFE